MGKSQETFSKKEKEKKRLKKRKDKLAKREERKANPKKRHLKSRLLILTKTVILQILLQTNQKELLLKLKIFKLGYPQEKMKMKILLSQEK